ncbi:hypothetical protein [Paracoccus saliphilus]|uniref:Uncharacterized protein n=1 Tax=Paracoccus saliphilus TaxID=405559 RepID=A0ABY7S742_9RHOB|nr:hypothetical protein [Paracoccus saliphilus]WCR01912.1 hypothetical protein JHX88_13430 [Paracoccus saliphilus]
MTDKDTNEQILEQLKEMNKRLAHIQTATEYLARIEKGKQDAVRDMTSGLPDLL